MKSADHAPCCTGGRIDAYLKSLVGAASDWLGDASSADYAGYEQMISGLAKETYQSQIEKGAAWVGTPEQISDQISDYQKLVGGFEIASLQFNFYDMPLNLAQDSVRLFASDVMPRFKN